jgi:predicted RND superfamily exporter protein
VLGLFVAYMVLGAQFNSFIHPVTVLLALPFSVTGAFLALRMTGISLNVYSLIGLLLLMGLVKKNSILLVDFTNERRVRGLGVREALPVAMFCACPFNGCRQSLLPQDAADDRLTQAHALSNIGLAQPFVA